MGEYLELFAVFFKIGLFSFGGGYAMLTMLSKELCQKKQYCSNEELLDYYAIGQVTPGIISVNVATFIGYKKKGIMGAIFATLGLILPSIIIISMLSNVLEKYVDNTNFIHILNGIKLGVIVLMFDAIIKLGSKAITKPIQLIIYLSVIFLVLFLNIKSIFVILTILFLGVLFKHA